MGRVICMIICILICSVIYINTNRTACPIVNGIPERYLIGLESITILEPYYRGTVNEGSWISYQMVRKSYYFYYAKRIKIFSGCDTWSLIHELAHHKNNMDGLDFKISASHGLEFKKARQEISKNLNSY